MLLVALNKEAQICVRHNSAEGVVDDILSYSMSETNMSRLCRRWHDNVQCNGEQW